MPERTFDWRSRHDPRSRDYPITSQMTVQPRTRRLWRGPAERLDQGAEGACVGFAWAIELLSAPVSARLPTPRDQFARDVYRAAQRIDEWPGEDYEGTSVLAGAKIVRDLGYIKRFWWAFGIDQVIDTLVGFGPVVIGIPWYDSMYDTRPDGLVEVGGRMVGGHAITLTGYGRRGFGTPRRTVEVVRWRNSWGPLYGIRGDGYIRVEDLARLLADRGEACVPDLRSHNGV